MKESRLTGRFSNDVIPEAIVNPVITSLIIIYTTKGFPRQTLSTELIVKTLTEEFHVFVYHVRRQTTCYETTLNDISCRFSTPDIVTAHPNFNDFFLDSSLINAKEDIK